MIRQEKTLIQQTQCYISANTDCVSKSNPLVGRFLLLWMFWLCTHWLQRGWDLLDIMDITTCSHWPEGVRSFRHHGCYDFGHIDQRVGSFRHHGCYDFVHADQTGWDLLDIMDVVTLYAMTRGGGIFLTSWMLRLCTHWPEGVGSFWHHGCYDFVRTDQREWDLLDIVHIDQRGWDLLDIMDVTTLDALARGGGIYWMSWVLRFCTNWPEGVGSFRHHGCYDFGRIDQRGWDLLDIVDVTTLYPLSMDVLTLYALTRGVGSFECHGCYDFVRTDQRGGIF